MPLRRGVKAAPGSIFVAGRIPELEMIEIGGRTRFNAERHRPTEDVDLILGVDKPSVRKECDLIMVDEDQNGYPVRIGIGGVNRQRLGGVHGFLSRGGGRYGGDRIRIVGMT